MISTSLKSLDEIRTGSLISLPRHITARAWIEAWSSACVGRPLRRPRAATFWNSSQLVVPAVADLDHARRRQRLCADQVALPRRRPDLRPAAVRLLHPLPGGAPAHGASRSAISASPAPSAGWSWSTSSTALPSPRSSSATSTSACPTSSSRRPRSTAPASSASSGASSCRCRRPSSWSRVIWQFTQIWNDFLFGVAFTGRRHAAR